MQVSTIFHTRESLEFNDFHLNSAGVGRTGTLIALDILMDQARRRRAVDVLSTVVKMRKYKAGMVQTEVSFSNLSF